MFINLLLTIRFPLFFSFSFLPNELLQYINGETNPSGAETLIFWENQVNIMAVDVPAPGVTRSLTLNVRGPSYLGLTRSIWRRQDISSHDIDYVEYM